MAQTAGDAGTRSSDSTIDAGGSAARARTKEDRDPARTCADAALVQRLLRNEPAAWHSFLAEYDATIRGAIWNTLGRFSSQTSSDDREEVRAVLLASLLKDDMRKLRQFDAQRGARLKTWISLLAAHTAWDHLRRMARTPVARSSGPGVQLAGGPTPLATFGAKQLLQAVVLKVQTFSSRDRDFLDRMFLDDHTPEQIACAMEISPRTVYTKKHKLTVRLKEAFGAYDDWV